MEKNKKVYVVKRGLKTGIFIDCDWDQDIKGLVQGFASAVFKSFSNLKDAEIISSPDKFNNGMEYSYQKILFISWKPNMP